MASIHFTQTDFDFAKLSALTPISTAGGAHLSKFRVNDATPFYLQLPKCRTRHGIVKTNSNKKHYCDLVFIHENESFIRWMERLEEFTRKTLYDNREKWFSIELNEHDIETLFISPLKLYKSGKCYLMRVNVPTVKGECALKIYDENQTLVSSEEVKDDTQVITVIEIQGIKCSSMSFYLEMEIKQMMVVAPVDQSFEMGCVISREPKGAALANSEHSIMSPAVSEIGLIPANHNANTINQSMYKDNTKTKTEEVERGRDAQHIESIPVVSGQDTQKLVGSEQEIQTLVDSDQDIQKLVDSEQDIQEFDIDLDKTMEVFQIKKRNDVYYEMYREAKRKARLAKDLAISSYLEAKRIRTTFLQRDTQESDLEDDEFYTQT